MFFFNDTATAEIYALSLHDGLPMLSFGVADGGAFFVFASDLNPTVFGSGAGFTLIANFADGTSASASASVPLMPTRSEEHTSELQSRPHLVCRLLLAKNKTGAIAAVDDGITVSH